MKHKPSRSYACNEGSVNERHLAQARLAPALYSYQNEKRANRRYHYLRLQDSRTILQAGNAAVGARGGRSASAANARADHEHAYDPPLDPGISPFVGVLAANGVETFESCDGGSGHAYPEPTIRFHGDRAEGFRALAVAQRAGLPVRALRRTWPINDGEPTGPWWEITFRARSTNGLPR